MTLLLVDGDCSFCMRAAVWLDARTSGITITRLQKVDVTKYGLTKEAVTKRLHAIGPEGVKVGSAAVAVALRHGSVLMKMAAAIIDAPGVRVLAQAGYDIVAKNRHRLPGGTAECRLSSDAT